MKLSSTVFWNFAQYINQGEISKWCAIARCSVAFCINAFLFLWSKLFPIQLSTVRNHLRQSITPKLNEWWTWAHLLPLCKKVSVATFLFMLFFWITVSPWLENFTLIQWPPKANFCLEIYSIFGTGTYSPSFILPNLFQPPCSCHLHDFSLICHPIFLWVFLLLSRQNNSFFSGKSPTPCCSQFIVLQNPTLGR